MQTFNEDPSRRLQRLVLGLALTCLCSCALVRGTLELPDKAVQYILPLGPGSKPIDPVDLQGKLMRFADEFLAAFNGEIDKLPVQPGIATERQIQTAKVSYNLDVLAIATGSNALANLLNMVSYVTLSRLVVADYWMPKVFGKAAAPLLASLQSAETEIWFIADSALQPEQQDELRKAIQKWHSVNADPRTFRAIHGMGFASAVAGISKDSVARHQAGRSSVFDLLGIDPLSGLDPATRELAQTRYFAERALFIVQRMPNLIRWETELLALETLELPQIERMGQAATEMSGAINRISAVAERLPGDFAAEREQLVAAMRSQTAGLTSLADQAKQAFGSGKAMADSTNGTLKTFQELVGQLESGPSEPDKAPFDIRDYTAAAAEIGKTAQQLQVLLTTIEQSTNAAQAGLLEQLNRQAQAGGRAFVDYVFLRIAILIGIACLAFLATAMLYRRIVRHPGTTANGGTNTKSEEKAQDPKETLLIHPPENFR